jgi:ATP-dependent RNA helicase DHX37/DHR1
MGNLRPRYNAKARGLTNGHAAASKKRKRDEVVDSNATIIDPKATGASTRVSEAAAGLGKASSRKRRRLESYITKKLKQEKRVELLKELACVISLASPAHSELVCSISSQSLPDSLALRTTASLGSGHPITSAALLDKHNELHDRKRDRAKAKLAQRKRGYHSDSDGEESEVVEVDGDDAPTRVDAAVQTVEAPSLVSGLGSGLKRAADGTLPAIVVKPRKAKATWGQRSRKVRSVARTFLFTAATSYRMPPHRARSPRLIRPTRATIRRAAGTRRARKTIRKKGTTTS